jgi:hypothetical protein
MAMNFFTQRGLSLNKTLAEYFKLIFLQNGSAKPCLSAEEVEAFDRQIAS